MYLLKVMSKKTHTILYKNNTGLTTNINKAKQYKSKEELLAEYYFVKERYKDNKIEIIIQEEFIESFLIESKYFSF